MNKLSDSSTKFFDQNLSLFYGKKKNQRGKDFLNNLKATYFCENLLKIYHPLVKIVFTRIPPELTAKISAKGSLTLKIHTNLFPYLTIGNEHLDII
jgi:hypothetical protein